MNVLTVVLVGLMVLTHGSFDVRELTLTSQGGTESFKFEEGKVPIVEAGVESLVKVRFSHPNDAHVNFDGCTMYVPDERAGSFEGAIAFSSVTDWSYDSMLGATPDDQWSQTVCRRVSQGFTLVMPEGDRDLFVTWTPDRWQLNVPLIMK